MQCDLCLSAESTSLNTVVMMQDGERGPDSAHMRLKEEGRKILFCFVLFSGLEAIFLFLSFPSGAVNTC